MNAGVKVIERYSELIRKTSDPDMKEALLRQLEGFIDDMEAAKHVDAESAREAKIELNDILLAQVELKGKMDKATAELEADKLRTITEVLRGNNAN